jgi:hypothetical protein
LGENKMTSTSVKILLVQTLASWYAISDLHNFLKSKSVKEILVFLTRANFVFLREWKCSETEGDEEYCWAIT